MEDAAVLSLRFPAILLLGFLLGSLPFSVWAGRTARGVDVRLTGTRNPGAANVWKSVGRATGVLVGAADAAKGAVAVWLAWRAGLPDDLAVWAALASVLGHDFSPLLGFRGGKGGATTVGSLACFVFPELVIVFTTWVLASLVDRRRTFAWSMIALTTLPALVLLAGRAPLPYLGGLPVRSWQVLTGCLVLIALLWARVGPVLRTSHG